MLYCSGSSDEISDGFSYVKPNLFANGSSCESDAFAQYTEPTSAPQKTFMLSPVAEPTNAPQETTILLHVDAEPTNAPQETHALVEDRPPNGAPHNCPPMTEPTVPPVAALTTLTPAEYPIESPESSTVVASPAGLCLRFVQRHSYETKLFSRWLRVPMMWWTSLVQLQNK